MLDLLKQLISEGFARVIVLDGEECGEAADCSVILALWRYEAACDPAEPLVQIHPYYPASQKAYGTASAFARAYADRGVRLRDDIRLKPILARLPGFTQGRNTLSYTPEFGSRFHIQTLTVAPKLEATHHLAEREHELHCGECHLCEAACPTNALEHGVFHRERCIRNWQMSGKPVPAEIRAKMGSCLLGCDVCQRVCPHNQKAEGEPFAPLSLEEVLTDYKAAAQQLKPMIGSNIAIPNRVLSQACLTAGCSGQMGLVKLLAPLTEHPSPVVAEHARWALETLGK